MRTWKHILSLKAGRAEFDLDDTKETAIAWANACTTWMDNSDEQQHGFALVDMAGGGTGGGEGSGEGSGERSVQRSGEASNFEVLDVGGPRRGNKDTAVVGQVVGIVSTDGKFYNAYNKTGRMNKLPQDLTSAGPPAELRSSNAGGKQRVGSGAGATGVAKRKSAGKKNVGAATHCVLQQLLDDHRRKEAADAEMRQSVDLEMYNVMDNGVHPHTAAPAGAAAPAAATTAAPTAGKRCYRKKSIFRAASTDQAT